MLVVKNLWIEARIPDKDGPIDREVEALSLQEILVAISLLSCIGVARRAMEN